MLLRLISSLAGRTPASTRVSKSRAGPGADAAAFESRASALERTVRDLCVAGNLEPAADAIRTRLPVPETADGALSLVRRVVLPLMENCATRGNPAVAVMVEEMAYLALVKRFEDPAHFVNCLSMIEAPMYRLGVRDAVAMAPLGPDGARRLLFFFHNLKVELAHTQLLHELVAAYLEAHPDDASSIGIAGVCRAEPAPLLLSLQKRWSKLAIHRLRPREGLRGPFNEVAGLLASGAYDRVIVVSAPLGISYLCGLIPPSRVGWLTMKYQLPCFEHLQHRCSFRSGMRRAYDVEGRLWLQAAPLFNGPATLKPLGPLSAVLQQARQFSTVLYTINREEKVRNPQFLERVARILESVPDAVFVWTGHDRLAAIDDFLAARGMRDRHFFAGWVVPDDLLQVGDIFLDTPVLSGNVAALATAAGVPVLSDAAAITWVGTFLPRYRIERGSAAVRHLDALIAPLEAQGIGLLCDGDDHYVTQAVKLAKDGQLRQQYGRALKAFASHYFFDAARSATDHFINLRSPVPA